MSSLVLLRISENNQCNCKRIINKCNAKQVLDFERTVFFYIDFSKSRLRFRHANYPKKNMQLHFLCSSLKLAENIKANIQRRQPMIVTENTASGYEFYCGRYDWCNIPL